MEDVRQDQTLGNHIEGLETDESEYLLGNLGKAIMMSHGMTLLAVTPFNDKMWPDALATIVAVHPIRLGDGDNDYIVVVLDATLCYMELCAETQERGLQFPEGFADECEDVMVTFNIVKVAMEQVIKERAEAAVKPRKRLLKKERCCCWHARSWR